MPTSINKQNGRQKSYASFGSLSESFNLNEIEELNTFQLKQLPSMKTQICLVLKLEKALLLVFDYGYTIKLLLTN